jgi:hypothetical protein
VRTYDGQILCPRAVIPFAMTSEHLKLSDLSQVDELPGVLLVGVGSVMGYGNLDVARSTCRQHPIRLGQ